MQPPEKSRPQSSSSSSSSRSSSASSRSRRRQAKGPQNSLPPGDIAGTYAPRQRGRSETRRSPTKKQRWRRTSDVSPHRLRDEPLATPRASYVIRFLHVVDDPRFDPRDLYAVPGQDSENILEASCFRFKTSLPEKEIVDRVHNAVPWAFRVFYNTKGDFTIRSARQRTRAKPKHSPPDLSAAPDGAWPERLRAPKQRHCPKPTASRPASLKPADHCGPRPPKGPPPSSWGGRDEPKGPPPQQQRKRKARLQTPPPSRTWPAGEAPPRRAPPPSRSQPASQRPAVQADAPWRAAPSQQPSAPIAPQSSGSGVHPQHLAHFLRSMAQLIDAPVPSVPGRLQLRDAAGNLI